MMRSAAETMIGLCLCAVGLGSLNSVTAFAQANNGAGEGQPVVHVDFYKLPPGRQDEWLALYRKVHLQVMQWEKEQGQVISETIYTRAAHHLSPDWDIAIMIVSPPPEKRRKPDLTRAQLLHKLFDSDMDGYVKAERERWALTLAHWDEQWVAVDLDKNPSLYYPPPLDNK
jgi:hypothetical protein